MIGEGENMLKVHMLPAKEGDFIWIEYGEEKPYFHILIDGGVETTGNTFVKVINEINSRGEIIEALILTHIDYDHIQGVVVGLEKISKEILKRVLKRIIFNTSKGIRNKCITRHDIKKWEEVIKVNTSTAGYGVGEAISLIELIKKKELTDRLVDYVIAGNIINIELEAEIKIISPDQESLEKLLTDWEEYDTARKSEVYANNMELSKKSLFELQKESLKYDKSINNRSSIAFIFEYNSLKLAFLGDSVPTVCIKGLKEQKINIPYNVDAIKISHHGSRSNTSDKLLKALPTENFLLSTNGKGGKVPSKVLIAHLLKCSLFETINLYCNYKWWVQEYNNKYFTLEDQEKYFEKNTLKVIGLESEGTEICQEMVFYGKYTANTKY